MMKDCFYEGGELVMKLLRNKKYTLKINEFIIDNVTYDGVYEDYNCICDICGKEIWNPHFFLDYDKNNAVSCSYHIGSECVKKCMIKMK